MKYLLLPLEMNYNNAAIITIEVQPKLINQVLDLVVLNHSFGLPMRGLDFNVNINNLKVFNGDDPNFAPNEEDYYNDHLPFYEALVAVEKLVVDTLPDLPLVEITYSMICWYEYMHYTDNKLHTNGEIYWMFGHKDRPNHGLPTQYRSPTLRYKEFKEIFGIEHKKFETIVLP